MKVGEISLRVCVCTIVVVVDVVLRRCVYTKTMAAGNMVHMQQRGSRFCFPKNIINDFSPRETYTTISSSARAVGGLTVNNVPFSSETTMNTLTRRRIYVNNVMHLKPRECLLYKTRKNSIKNVLLCPKCSQ